MEKTGEVKLARTLGVSSIILLGVSALIGGGIFSLLGPAAGLSGPALFMAMILGGFVAFLNLQTYIALGTTFPETGGGYLWVRKGLGPFQGFLAGWFSWFAHAAAAGLYALSLGYFIYQIISIVWTYFGDFHLNQFFVIKISATLAIIILGYFNWKGVRTSSRAGNFITIVLLGILSLFIIFGALEIAQSPAPFKNFTPLLPNGWLGILAAASFFYIAFEGSEIQVQTGEETKDPRRTLKIALIGSWAIVVMLYLLISLVIVGATSPANGTVWETLSQWKEGAIAQAAKTFMPFGYLLMILGGFAANLAALNATIYSASRVSYALARDQNIWSRLSNIHLQNLTPYVAVITSCLLIILMVNLLPLFDVASAASLLFILLFLQLNIAGIKIHYKWPETQWGYKIPLFPVVPIAAIIIYIILATTMLHVNATAWIIVAFWMLLGLVNYFAYAENRSREIFETEIVYEEAVRIGPKTGKRILLPIAPGLALDEIKNLAETAFVLTSKYDGELVIVTVHEIHPALPLDQSLIHPDILEKEKHIFNQLQHWVAEYNQKTGPEVKDINFHSLILIGRDVVDVILDVVKMEGCDLLMLNWGGYHSGLNVILSRKIDRILREAKCDLLVVKNPAPPKTAMVAVNPKGSGPFHDLVGEITAAIKAYYQPHFELLAVVGQEIPAYLKPDPTLALKSLNLKKKDFDEINFISARSVIDGILQEIEKKNIDLIIVGSAKPKLLGEIRIGSLAETLLSNTRISVMIVRGHQGVAEVFWKKLLRVLTPTPPIS